MYSGVVALALFLSVGPPDANATLKAAWNISPNGAGSTLIPPAPDQRDGWVVHNILPVPRDRDWLAFNYQNGVPSLLLNTPGANLFSITSQWTITKMTPMPWSIEFTATQGGTGWIPPGQSLVITITIAP